MTVVKICGNTNLEDVELALSLGADLIGFIFCQSPRRVEPDLAAKIVRAVGGQPATVGVFCDQPLSEVVSIIDQVGLTMAQLGGEEDEAYAADLPVPSMRVFRMAGKSDRRAIRWAGPGPVMLDRDDPVLRGGTGVGWNWNWATRTARLRPTFIAGGLTAVNVGEVVRLVRPHGVDVCTGVESSTGHKDPRLLAEFISAAHQAADVGVPR